MIESIVEIICRNLDITVIVSVLSLLLNILFYIIIAPKINLKVQRKDKLFEYSTKLLSYLSTVVSMNSFEGVPTQIRSYSLAIHLMFKNGTAPKPLSECLECVFQLAKERRNMYDTDVILKWENEFIIVTRDLRKFLGKYTGSF